MDKLLTVLFEVVAILNCRPLTYEYEELGGEMLTPSHLCWPDDDDDEDWDEVFEYKTQTFLESSAQGVFV
jgi:hypothetical protein